MDDVGADMNTYAPFAYDAVWMLARAMHELIEIDGKSEIVGSELHDKLLTINHVGATGEIEFYESNEASDWEFQGDRQVGAAYEVLNYDPDTNDLVATGSWAPSSDCFYTTEYRDCFTACDMSLGNCQEWKYSDMTTLMHRGLPADNSVPTDIPASTGKPSIVRIGALSPFFKLSGDYD